MKNLVILFEYLQSISGENFPPNTWTIITCMKQRMHLFTSQFTFYIYIYVLGKEEKKKNEGCCFTSIWDLTFSTIIYFIY